MSGAVLAAVLLVQASLPEAAISAFERGQAAYKRGDLKAAAESYKEAVRAAPTFAGGWFNLGLALDGANRPVEALEAFRTARKHDATMAAADLFIGIESYRLHNYPAAETALGRAVKSMAGTKDPWLWLGKTQLALGRNAEAARTLESARKLAPKDGNVLYNLGLAYSRLSQSAYQELVESAPESDVAQLVLAQANTEREQYSAALRRYQKILANDPAFPGIHEAIGSIYVKLNRQADARAEFEAELAIDPSNEAALTQLGMILTLEGEFAKAERVLSEALEVNPASFLARFARGRALLGLGRAAEALADLEASQKREPANPQVAFQLSRALQMLGRDAEAKAALLRAKEMSAQDSGRREQ